MFRAKNILISSLIIVMLILSGCSQATDAASSGTTSAGAASSVEASVQVPEEAGSAETMPEAVPFEFNTHVYPCFLDACYPDDYRESFFNLCDALQTGEDTFECASQKIYDFCMDEVTHNQLYPVACMQITGISPDGSIPYENGIGRIYYTKSKEDFLERQENFKRDIEDIMNAYVKSDYSDYEKCLALYDYIVSNYEYDTDGTVDSSKDGSFCACMKYKKGICADFGPLYAYLLLQNGIDAIDVSNYGTEDSIGYHGWTFLELDGKGYHTDATWGLKADKTDDSFTLDYFMMTDDDRAASGYPADLMEIYLIPYFYAKECKEYDFTADDNSYRLPEYSFFSRIDTDANILYYTNFTIDDAEHEFKYE